MSKFHEILKAYKILISFCLILETLIFFDDKYYYQLLAYENSNYTKKIRKEGPLTLAIKNQKLKKLYSDLDQGAIDVQEFLDSVGDLNNFKMDDLNGSLEELSDTEEELPRLSPHCKYYYSMYLRKKYPLNFSAQLSAFLRFLSRS